MFEQVKIGSPVKVHFNAESHSFVDDNGNEKWFTSLKCFKLETLDKKI